MMRVKVETTHSISREKVSSIRKLSMIEDVGNGTPGSTICAPSYHQSMIKVCGHSELVPQTWRA